jgi:hypothetical protein
MGLRPIVPHRAVEYTFSFFTPMPIKKQTNGDRTELLDKMNSQAFKQEIAF